MGLTLNEKDCYICDHNNHRIQILYKNNSNYFNQWEKDLDQKGIIYPCNIYYCKLQNLFYITNENIVYLFLAEGLCIQRISDIRSGGITIVCSTVSRRILIYRRDEE